MNIETVKIQGSGYLLNGTIHVPAANGNSEYEAIKQWIAEGNTPEPEFTEAELAERELAKVKAEAQAYLLSTDWVEPFLIKHELGIAILPEDGNKLVIARKRDEVRELLQ